MNDNDYAFSVKFRPIERETLSLLADVHDAEGNPYETFNRLMSAFFCFGRHHSYHTGTNRWLCKSHGSYGGEGRS